MSQILALASAVLYGVADFSGGLATRSIAAWRVTAWSQLLGVPLLLIGLPLVSAQGPGLEDLAFGVVGALFGLLGVVALYGALAAGTMSIVSPLTGVLTALVPVAWGLVTGESIRAIQWVGIALAVAAVVLVARNHVEAELTAAVVGRAVVASLAFAAFFIALDQTSEASGVWPLVAGRAVTIPLAFGIAAAVGSAAVPPSGALRPIAIAGGGDAGANIAILLALQTGPLGVNSVLAALYPAFTALAAVIVLRERPTGVQTIGILLALVAASVLVA